MDGLSINLFFFNFIMLLQTNCNSGVGNTRIYTVRKVGKQLSKDRREKNCKGREWI